ncbi:PepSY domain-containing protein [Facklamia sp. 7083-14-GEN3]|uniref:PepSY domain-containing protein n=1 Tax=Facklamia sp. 7083-14-GEN3 TaxID=2973478 RepID=UPI00215BE4F7|nr:PepSY domain-containing protein [Facklamia sp. 7083-14-GEN3]MCR8969464.1 PepSY domain-containing protein [Facklamia sp. 7083-14-GEN3]
MSHNKNNSLLGTIVLLSGIAIGAAGTLLYKENRPLNPGKVLESIREAFALQGEITGSWIDYDPIEYTAYDSRPLVYTGGISRKENNQIIHYHFVADIYTGEILNTFEA